MTYEEVKTELMKRGFPKGSVESKYVPQVMDIVLGTDYFVKISEDEEEIKRQERRVIDAKTGQTLKCGKRWKRQI